MVIVGNITVSKQIPVVYTDGDAQSAQALANRGFTEFINLTVDPLPLDTDLLFIGGAVVSSFHAQVHDQLIAEGQPHFENLPDVGWVIIANSDVFSGFEDAFIASASSPFAPGRRVVMLAGIHEEGTFLAAQSSNLYAITVSLTIEASPVTDRFSRYHGKSLDEALDSNFWSTEPEKIIRLSSSAFTHSQLLGVAEGSHFIIYGNSAATGYLWYVRILLNGELIAEGNVDRTAFLRADFTILGVAPPEGFGQYVSDDLPTQADPGSIVVVAVTVRNDGVISDIGVQAVDADTDIILDGPTRVSQLAGESVIHTVSFTMPSVPLNVRFDCGHY